MIIIRLDHEKVHDIKDLYGMMYISVDKVYT